MKVKEREGSSGGGEELSSKSEVKAKSKKWRRRKVKRKSEKLTMKKEGELKSKSGGSTNGKVEVREWTVKMNKTSKSWKAKKGKWKVH